MSAVAFCQPKDFKNHASAQGVLHFPNVSLCSLSLFTRSNFPDSVDWSKARPVIKVSGAHSAQ